MSDRDAEIAERGRQFHQQLSADRDAAWQREQERERLGIADNSDRAAAEVAGVIAFLERGE